MKFQAYLAVKAAKNTKNWGSLPARQFVIKRGVSPRLYRIARQCEATMGQTFERRDAMPSTLEAFV